MNSYKKLVNNSIIFGVGRLGSRIVSFLLVPLYTYYLSTGEYGTVDLTMTTVNLLIPIVSVSAYEAVLRFTMDENEEPQIILSNSMTIALVGFVVALFFYPILNYFNVLQGNLVYLYMILFAQMVERVLAQYIRALGKVKMFALNGILLTFTTGILNVLFLVYFGLGIVGYYWALILSYLFSSVYLIIFTDSYKDLRFSNYNKNTINDLISYSIPMIPNSLMWWLINASSRYFIRWFIGVSANGLFAVASRIPSILTIFYQVFNQAWQLSAIEEFENEKKSEFYTVIFDNLSSFMFIGASGIIIFIKLIFELFFAAEYFYAWRIVPFLLLGTIFSSFSTFLGTNYIAAKQTKGVFKTSVYGGIISLILNIAFIPSIGLVGAGISSMVSFFAMFLLRYFDTRQYIELDVDWIKLALNIFMILLQIGLLSVGLGRTIELFSGVIIFIMLLIVNKQLLILGYKLLKGMIAK